MVNQRESFLASSFLLQHKVPFEKKKNRDERGWDRGTREEEHMTANKNPTNKAKQAKQKETNSRAKKRER